MVNEWWINQIYKTNKYINEYLHSLRSIGYISYRWIPNKKGPVMLTYDDVFFVILDKHIENNACTLVVNCFCAHERVILVFISRVSAEIVCHDSTYIRPINDDPHTLTMFLTRPDHILQMTSQSPDNCDASTWKVISNSLDTGYIHGDIHGWSCKKFEQLIKCQLK